MSQPFLRNTNCLLVLSIAMVTISADHCFVIFGAWRLVKVPIVVPKVFMSFESR